MPACAFKWIYLEMSMVIFFHKVESLVSLGLLNIFTSFRMDRFHSIWQRRPEESQLGTPTHTNQRRKSKENSAETVFRFPKSVVDKFVLHDKNKTLKMYRSTGKISESPVKLGTIGQQLHHNLRQVILNQTKSLLNTLKPSTSSPKHKIYATIPVKSSSCGKDQTISMMQHQSNMKTLNLLQKTITKDDLFYVQQDILQLHTSKLPILRKRQANRKRPTRTRQQKVSQVLTQVVNQPNQKKIAPRKSIEVKQQKPFIRGWDTTEPQVQ